MTRLFKPLLCLGLLAAVSLSAQESPKVMEMPCPAEQFIEPGTSVFNRAGASEVNAYCEDGYLIVESNGLPDFKLTPMTPNDLRANRFRWRIPLLPQWSEQTTEVPFLGEIGVTVTGISIFAPNEAKDLGYGDAKLDGILDDCGGHVGPNGAYHFHAQPSCPFQTAEELASTIIGYAFDGYPIRLPYVCADNDCSQLQKVKGSWQVCEGGECTPAKVREVFSSWNLEHPEVHAAWDKHVFVEGSGDLDQCNGMFDAEGNYSYYATETFPYNLGCYHGVVDRNLNRLMPGWSQKDSVKEPTPPPNSARGQRGMQRGGGPPGGGPSGGHPDLKAAAKRLGISEKKLKKTLGPPPPDLKEAAKKLGITEKELRSALHGH